MSEQIVVLGMHRSGTSVVALILKALGVHMGDDTLGAGASNPFGHEEDTDFFDLNERFLARAKGAWDFPPARSRLDQAAARFDAEISRLIEERNIRSKLWGWKDPRTCLLFDYYHRHLGNYKVVYVTRDSNKVALSLRKRDRMPLRKGLRLCAIFSAALRESLSKIRPETIFRVDFDDLLAGAENPIDELIVFLGVDVSTKQRRDAIDMLKPQAAIKELGRTTASEQRRKKVRKAFAHPVLAGRFLMDKCYRFVRYRLER